MANYAYLVGCESREAAARYDFSEAGADSGPWLEAAHMIPLLWLACFAPTDALTVTIADSPIEESIVTVLYARIGDVIDRLRRREAGVLGLTGPSFAPLYADWISFLGRNCKNALLLRTEQLFAMEGYEKSGLRLKAALRFMAVADSGARIKERAAIDWLAALDGTFEQRLDGEDGASAALRWRIILSGAADSDDPSLAWPAPPSREEIAFAAARPQAAPPPQPGTPADEEYTLTRNIRKGVFADSGKEGLRLAMDKLAGKVPLGVNAPTKGLRKLIGGGNELLQFLWSAGLGLFLLLFGVLSAWAGFGDKPDWMLLGIGAVLAALSLLPLQSARVALRKLRIIARA